MVWQKILWKGDGEDRDGWKLRETTASAAAANWRDAHLQMLKGIGKGVNRGPKTKHIMTKIMLNMNVKSLIGVVPFRYSLRFHIGSLMGSARMFACLFSWFIPRTETFHLIFFCFFPNWRRLARNITRRPKKNKCRYCLRAVRENHQISLQKTKYFLLFLLIPMFFTPIFRLRVQIWISLILIPSFTRSNSEEPWNLQTNTELSKRLLLQPNARSCGALFYPQIFGYILVRSYMQILQGIWQIPTLLCLDWTGLDSVSGSSAGLDWIRINGSWIWTGLDLSNSIHSIVCSETGPSKTPSVWSAVMWKWHVTLDKVTWEYGNASANKPFIYHCGCRSNDSLSPLLSNIVTDHSADL